MPHIHFCRFIIKSFCLGKEKLVHFMFELTHDGTDRKFLQNNKTKDRVKNISF
ncbi:hypothetical protein BDF14DRAFT_1826054 [Spinellus fusiger]|nr:hypothetical protein BDF14DRAFT_1826054 [Spinellus fusiger]